MSDTEEDFVKFAYKVGSAIRDPQALTDAEQAQLDDLLAVGDTDDRWVIYNGMGGFVCDACGMPVESEPCEVHQPIAYARCNA